MKLRFGLNVLSVSMVGLACGVFAPGCGTKSSPSASGGDSGAASTTGGASATGGGQSGGNSNTSAGTGNAGAGAGNAGAGAGGAALGGSGGAATGGGASGSGGSSGTHKIMAIGDSITRATCWRARLWQSLNQSHPGAFDLVGTLASDNGCTPSGYDQDNQGYSSSLLTEIVAGVTTARTCDPVCPTLSDLAAAFTAKQPDIALIHFGTNDVWNGKPAADIINGYSQLVDKLRAANPNVKVLIAKIIPMNVTNTTCSGCSCAGCVTDIPALNTQIDSWAPTKSTAASPIIVVDQYTGFDAVADTRDGVHPNDSGSQKMADKWAAALGPLF
jgi:lysophospholipase L1-like esterase